MLSLVHTDTVKFNGILPQNFRVVSGSGSGRQEVLDTDNGFVMHGEVLRVDTGPVLLTAREDLEGRSASVGFRLLFTLHKVGADCDTFLTKQMYLIYLSCFHKFGLPPSAICPVIINVKDGECLPLVLDLKGWTSLP